MPTASENQTNLNYPPVIKSGGVTVSERDLGKFCEKTFLSLWSYPGVFRNQGQATQSSDGKEICDLLVVFGEHVIVFSDKHCAFQVDKDHLVAWQRWFKRAIAKSAEQAWGAKRWLEQHPTRVFLDRKCTQRLPFTLPEAANAKFHLVVVAHGISDHISKHYGGTGSLLIDSGIRGLKEHNQPFHIGDLDPTNPFIHVFDDHTLQTVMESRDTISDFVAYLEKREKLLRSATKILAPGEEELLPFYLRNLNASGQHDFVFDINGAATCIALEEGHWSDFQKHPQRVAQVREDGISYVWDSIIERFNHYALRGEQYFVTSGGITDAEKVLRFMAREPRFKRRALAQSLKHMLLKTPGHQRMLRIIPPLAPGDPFYVMLLFPILTFAGVTDEIYRNARADFLQSCCLVVRLLHPNAEHIVGIATESGVHGEHRSEDACYFDGKNWTEEMAERAREAQINLRILVKPIEARMSVSEYPDAPTHSGKIGRNELCPCGSKKKHKKCCIKA